MQTIFSTILLSFFKGYNFSEEMEKLADPIVDATLNAYGVILNKMLPTPTKVHYTFNLRDVSRVFQGISKAMPDKFKQSEKIIKLWIHEM